MHNQQRRSAGQDRGLESGPAKSAHVHSSSDARLEPPWQPSGAGVRCTAGLRIPGSGNTCQSASACMCHSPPAILMGVHSEALSSSSVSPHRRPPCRCRSRCARRRPPRCAARTFRCSLRSLLSAPAKPGRRAGGREGRGPGRVVVCRGNGGQACAEEQAGGPGCWPLLSSRSWRGGSAGHIWHTHPCCSSAEEWANERRMAGRTLGKERFGVSHCPDVSIMQWAAVRTAGLGEGRTQHGAQRYGPRQLAHSLRRRCRRRPGTAGQLPTPAQALRT